MNEPGVGDEKRKGEGEERGERVGKRKIEEAIGPEMDGGRREGEVSKRKRRSSKKERKGNRAISPRSLNTASGWLGWFPMRRADSAPALPGRRLVTGWRLMRLF